MFYQGLRENVLLKFSSRLFGSSDSSFYLAVHRWPNSSSAQFQFAPISWEFILELSKYKELNQNQFSWWESIPRVHSMHLARILIVNFPDFRRQLLRKLLQLLSSTYRCRWPSGENTTAFVILSSISMHVAHAGTVRVSRHALAWAPYTRMSARAYARAWVHIGQSECAHACTYAWISTGEWKKPIRQVRCSLVFWLSAQKTDTEEHDLALVNLLSFSVHAACARVCGSVRAILGCAREHIRGGGMSTHMRAHTHI